MRTFGLSLPGDFTGGDIKLLTDITNGEGAGGHRFNGERDSGFAAEGGEEAEAGGDEAVIDDSLEGYGEAAVDEELALAGSDLRGHGHEIELSQRLGEGRCGDGEEQDGRKAGGSGQSQRSISWGLRAAGIVAKLD